MRHVDFLNGPENGDPARGIGIRFRKGPLASDEGFVKRQCRLKKLRQRRPTLDWFSA